MKTEIYILDKLFLNWSLTNHFLKVVKSQRVFLFFILVPYSEKMYEITVRQLLSFWQTEFSAFFKNWIPLDENEMIF